MCKWVIQVFRCSRFLWQSLPDGKELMVWVFIKTWLLDNYDSNDRELLAWNCLNVVMVMNSTMWVLRTCTLSGILHLFIFLWKDFDLDNISKKRMEFSLSVIITISLGV